MHCLGRKAKDGTRVPSVRVLGGREFVHTNSSSLGQLCRSLERTFLSLADILLE